MAKNFLTEENFEKLNSMIETHKDMQGPLMPILHGAQHIFGAIPMEVQKVISEELHVPLADVSVGTTSPDGKFSLEATRCIGACGLAPVLTVNEDVYGRLTLNDIPGIIQKYTSAN